MSAQTLPHWDMSTVYLGLQSPEFERDLQAFFQSIDELAALFDQRQINAQTPGPLKDQTKQAFELILDRLNRVLERRRLLFAYVASFVTTDSRDALAQAKLSQLQQHAVKLTQLVTRWVAWLGSLDVEALIQRSAIAQTHAFMLRKAKRQAKHLMSPAEEALAAELNLTGGEAWQNLYGSYSSQLMVPVKLKEKTKVMPMSAVRNLAYDADRSVRRSAYKAELQAWEKSELPIAFALNGVKGEYQALARRRGWGSPLEVALFDNHIDRAALDAMLDAARESFPDFRRYLKVKAKALRVKALAWYDLFAPLGKERKWSFGAAQDFIVEQFGTFSPKMRALAQRAFQERWIDAQPREGKRDGAFCMPLRRDESRILSNYKPSYGGVSTLAHELGHAYHNLNLSSQPTEFLRDEPMTLAETASIFCETIARKAALKGAPVQEQIAILEASLQGSCQVVVDITSRFLFEQGVFDQRRERELSAQEFKTLMLDAQRRTYGDGLDQGMLHPYMWAVKPHYYRASESFYNFPYMFGLLFALGLYAQYEQDAARFKGRYDQLLASTGTADAATLAQGFGMDIRKREFWRSSLDVIRQDIRRFEALIVEK